MESNRALPSEKAVSTRYAAEETKDIPAGLAFPRHFSRAGISPYDEIEWETRTAAIVSEKGELIFQQENVEVPKSWSQMATNIVVSKYFHGLLGTPQRERSVRQLVDRVVRTISEWGAKGGYFST